jgi:hypothetical protein
MKYTITTYADNGDEIVSRNYNSTGSMIISTRETFGIQLESILEDSHTYLEEQALDNGKYEMPGFEGTLEELDTLTITGEHECETDNSAGNVDADGTCLTCGKTDLI